MALPSATGGFDLGVLADDFEGGVGLGAELFEAEVEARLDVIAERGIDARERQQQTHLDVFGSGRQSEAGGEPEGRQD